MNLKSSSIRTSVGLKSNNGEMVEVKNIPVLVDEDTGIEYYTMADLYKEDQKRIANKFGVSYLNIWELTTLYADVRQRIKGIKQKFRFNKILFYITEKIKQLFGSETFILDEMVKARAGPIPLNLEKDLNDLRSKDLIDIKVIRDGKELKEYKDKWDHQNKGSITCILTNEGEKLANDIWKELDDDLKEIIIEVKSELLYLDTNQLKDKVHNDYPEMQKSYIDDDIEDFEFLIQQ